MTTNRWYVRSKDGKFLLGLCSNSGAALASGTEVTFSADTSVLELEEEDQIVPIPNKYLDDFCKGVAAELLSIDNVVRADYVVQFNQMKSSFTARNTIALASGARKKGLL
jgi:hypothetical protein